MVIAMITLVWKVGTIALKLKLFMAKNFQRVLMQRITCLNISMFITIGSLDKCPFFRGEITYLDDGRLDNNNHLSERVIKPFVMGRKAWLFSNNVEGAQAGATIFSLIETCKHHGIEPYDYFRHVLNVLPTCTTLDDYEKLLPFNIDKTVLIVN